MLLNLGFGITIVAALLLLFIAWGASYYNDHLASAATVNGQSISKDAWNKQMAVNAFRADYEQRQLRTLQTAGHIRSSDASTRLSILQQRLQQTQSISLEQLIDGTIQEQLAAQQGITVSDADVDAKVAEDATTPELRHAWMIAVSPELKTGESVATDEEKAAAKAKAEQALADLKAGKDWDSVAKAVSTDATKDQAGDLSYIDKDASLDTAFRDALMAAAKDTPTDVIEGADGTYRIGRVSEIIPAKVDATFASQIDDFTSGSLPKVNQSDLRAAIRRDVVHDKLSAAILAPYLQASPQRDVEIISLSADVDPSTGTPTGKESQDGAVKIRHILYAPNGDASTAGTLKPDDPAWAAAEAKANATYEKLKADPSLFASIAKSDSNDPGSASRGGTYWFTKDDSLLPEFSTAIFDASLQPGQLLAPVKTAAGWHVIQYLHPAPDSDWAAKLKADIDAGTVTFADAARDNSDTFDPQKGDVLGWIAKGQLTKQVEDAIFAAPIGKVSDPLKIDGSGTYLFLVDKEESRTPDADQKQTLESNVFSDWYSTEKAKYTVTRDAVPGSDQTTS
jgi:parvulin-like peptidyl-prolyl isomerase